MGLWQANFGDLKAAGIELTAGQREVVATGGEVLVIQCLVEPGSFYCQCGMGHPARDRQGNVVMVAEILETYPVDQPAPALFHRPAGTWTLADLCNEYYDDHWRFWPSIVGQRKVGVDCMEIVDDERPQVRRVWDGYPIAEIGAVTAQNIVDACNAVVESTPWWVVDRMIGILEDGEIPAEEDLEPDDPWSGHRDFIETRQSLRNEGWWDEEANEPNSKFSVDLDYPPMNHYLSQADHDVWQRLHITSRQNALRAARTIKRGERNLYSNAESEFDPWF